MLRFIVCFFVFAFIGVIASDLGSPDSGVIEGAFCAFLVFKLIGKKNKKMSKDEINRREFKKAEQDFLNSMSEWADEHNKNIKKKSDIQSTDSYCTLKNFYFSGWGGANYETCELSLKNGHSYNLHRLRDTSSSSRYFVYIYEIEGKKLSKKYFSTVNEAVEAIEEMDCKFCKWFKKKKGRNPTYQEHNDWLMAHRE